MENLGYLSVKLFLVFVGFGGLASVLFIWVLPDVPHWSRSYLTFSIGPVCAALVSAYFTYHSMSSLASTINKVLMGAFFGAVIGTGVLLLMLFLIANLKGT